MTRRPEDENNWRRKQIIMLIKVAIPNQVQLKLVPNFPALLMGKQNDVHYIGGAEVLPAPLEAEAEARAIRELGTETGSEAQTMEEQSLLAWLALNGLLSLLSYISGTTIPGMPLPTVYWALPFYQSNKCWMVVVCASDPSTQEAKAGGSLSSRPAWSKK